MVKNALASVAANTAKSETLPSNFKAAALMSKGLPPPEPLPGWLTELVGVAAREDICASKDWD
jgi:hypothetical protein